MKAKIKETGEIISVEPMWDRDGTLVCYEDRDTHVTYSCSEIECDYLPLTPIDKKEWEGECEHLMFINKIDWEQRRFELVKAVLPACITADIEQPLGAAIRYADNVVYLLKTSGKEK